MSKEIKTNVVHTDESLSMMHDLDKLRQIENESVKIANLPKIDPKLCLLKVVT